MASPSTDRPFVSRHPVYYPDVRLHSYQLAVERRDDGDREAARQALATFSPIGLEQIAGKQPAWVPVPQSAILDGAVGAWSADRVMIQVLGDAFDDPRVREQLESLASKGYAIAVDDSEEIVPDADVGSWARIVRVDAQDADTETLERALERLARSNVELMATNVDTQEMFELCRRHGFDFYQGYFFCSPHADGREVPQNRLAALRVLTKLRQPDISLGEVEETIESDVGLSYQLLRFANSAFVGLPREVESIGHAVKLVGMDRIRLWASLLMFSRMEDKPRELMITAIVRAAQCERLATAAEFARPESFFTVGLLSVLDALMDRPMADAVGQLPLNDEVRAALVGREGPAGEALSAVVAYERNVWSDVRFAGLPAMTMRGQYIDSVGWARRISEGLMI